MTKTRYEWCVETVWTKCPDTSDGLEIRDHFFGDTAAEVMRAWKATPEPDHRHDLVLVRDVDEYGDLLDRSWAYVKDGKLPAEFTEPSGAGHTYRPTGVAVPKRFHVELARASR